MSTLTQAQAVTLEGTLAKRVAGMASLKGESFEAVVNRLVEKALKDVVYRQKRNQKQWAMTKALKEALASGKIVMPSDEEIEAEFGSSDEN